MKESLLFLSAHLPSMNYPQAGHKIAYQRLKEMSEQYNVHLITFVNIKESEYFDQSEYPFCASVHIFPLTQTRRVLNYCKNISLPLKIAIRQDSQVKEKIKSLGRYRYVHFEYSEMAEYVRMFNYSVRCSVTVHDVIFQSIQRKNNNRKNVLAKMYWSMEEVRQRNWEVNTMMKMTEIHVLSDKDRQLLSDNGIVDITIRTIPPVVDPRYFNIRRDHVEKGSILFVGAMDRIENIDGVLWFINDVVPILKKRNCKFKLYIVGANPDGRIKKLASEYIIVTGFVPDLASFYSRCAIAIAPLREGAGVKIKVLESLASGMTVIATSIGAEGIDDIRLNIADDAQSFAELILKKLLN